jgi:hypothetical protein
MSATTRFQEVFLFHRFGVRSFLFGAWLVFFAGQAHAKVRVGVLIGGADEISKQQANLVEYLGLKHFERDPGYEVLWDGEWFAPETRVQSSIEFKAALDSMRRGLDAYDELRLDAAIDLLASAIEKFETVPWDIDGDPERNHLKAISYLGASLCLNGNLKKGKEVFRRLLTFERRAQLDKNIFPPSIVEFFEDVRKELSHSPTGSLSVASFPASGKVFLDGVFRGVSPLGIDRLFLGDHLLVIRASGFKPWGKKVTVLELEGQPVRCALMPNREWVELSNVFPATIEKLDPAEPLSEPVSSILKRSQLDRVVLGRVQQKDHEVKYLLVFFDVRNGKAMGANEGEWEEGSPNFSQAIDADFASLVLGKKVPRSKPPKLEAPVVVVAPQPLPERIKPEPASVLETREPIYKRWYFWTAIGAVVVGGTVLSVLLLSQKQPAESQILLFF